MIKSILTALFLLGFAFATQAQSPHFIKGPTAVLASSGDYTVSFKEAGLGSSPVTYTLTAGAGTLFTWQCFTKSGNNPQGAPNGISGSGESVSTTVTPHNGQVTASISLIPEKDGASCQGHGLVLRLIAADYDGVVFTDNLGNTFNLPDLNSGTE